jgi:hypothetical protein
MMLGLAFGFAGPALLIFISGKPEIMEDMYPHCTKKFRQPLLLFMIHSAMMANTELLL